MGNRTLVVVTGPSGAGKTTLSRQLASALGMPCIGKDAIKEILYDRTGIGDREFSRGQGRACYDIMALCAREFLPSCPLMLESNFSPEGLRDMLAPLRERAPLRVFIVSCIARPETLFRRTRRRVESGERHPGHVDGDDFAEFIGHIVPADSYAICEPDMLMVVDTEDFAMVDRPAIVGAIRVFMDGGNGNG